MTREQAIEKIKKLQTLKEGAAKIDSDGEAKNAAAIIDKLQKQFGITMAEVYSYSSDDTEDFEYEEEPEYEEEGFSSQEEHDHYQQNVDKVCDRFYDDLARLAQSVLDRYLDTEEEERSEVTRLFAEYRQKVMSNTTLRRKCENLGIDMEYLYNQVENKTWGEYNDACKDANAYRARKARERAQEAQSQRLIQKKSFSDEIVKKITFTVSNLFPHKKKEKSFKNIFKVLFAGVLLFGATVIEFRDKIFTPETNNDVNELYQTQEEENFVKETTEKAREDIKNNPNRFKKFKEFSEKSNQEGTSNY